MLAKVFEFVFGCRHRRVTRPITPAYRYYSEHRYSYVACLECGKQFYYDTRNLRVGSPVPPHLMTAHQPSSTSTTAVEAVMPTGV